NGIILYVNSNVLHGALEAQGTSVLIVAQSTIPQDPIHRDNGCVWFVNIEGPYEAYYGQPYSLNGSAWIDKDPASPLMDFGSYQIFYSTDMGITWIAAGPEQNIEKRHELLGDFNTALLPSDGSYLIKVTLKDNQTTPVAIDAVVALNVLPAYLSVSEPNENIRVYPNPATDNVFIEFPGQSDCTIKLLSLDGRIILKKNTSSGNTIQMDVSGVKPGMYFIKTEGDIGSYRSIMIN
ncbi:MAG: T9SS type A sorting domain-containing protein, partial [Bacteroidales bacterium]|nr:T9SS type A sorting domain-containing protein [Bacteroidales bacterium]